MNDLYFFLAIGMIAFLYSSVGHGGASGYLALMAVYGFAPAEMRSSALILNIIVSAVAFISFYSGSSVNLKKLTPFLLGSVPAAFLGAMIHLSTPIFRILLAAVLVFAILRLLLSIRNNNYDTRRIPFLTAFIWGILIGMISGMIGIGGGILLSPLLILMRWASIRESACFAAAFILVNSISGITGLFLGGIHLSSQIYFCILIAFTGGLLGSSLGSRYFPLSIIKYALMMVLLFAGFKLMAG